MDGKQIQEVTAEGIRYIDDNGDEQFIDFEACYQRHNQENEGAGDWMYKRKFVGDRNFSDYGGRVPWIEFYTEPRTRFQFETQNDFGMVLGTMKKLGWYTHDMA